MENKIQANRVEPFGDRLTTLLRATHRISRIDPAASLDPFLTIRTDLLLPDRYFDLEPIDRVFAGLERLLAVRGADRDDHAGLADGEPTDAMGHGDAPNSPALANLVGDLAHFGLRHLGVGLVVEKAGGPTTECVIAHDA